MAEELNSYQAAVRTAVEAANKRQPCPYELVEGQIWNHTIAGAIAAYEMARVTLHEIGELQAETEFLERVLVNRGLLKRDG